MHSCQLSMSSCSKVPEGLNPLMAPKRMISLISAGAVLSQKAQAVTSTLSGPLGCHTRKVRDPARSMGEVGEDGSGEGVEEVPPRSQAVHDFLLDLRLVLDQSRYGRTRVVVRAEANHVGGPSGHDGPTPSGVHMALLLAKEFLIAERWFQPT